MIEVTIIILAGIGTIAYMGYLDYTHSCQHTYEVFEQMNMLDKRGINVGRKMINRCTKCGKLESRTFLNPRD